MFDSIAKDVDDSIWMISRLTTQIDEDNTLYADNYLRILKEITRKQMSILSHMEKLGWEDGQVSS